MPLPGGGVVRPLIGQSDIIHDEGVFGRIVVSPNAGGLIRSMQHWLAVPSLACLPLHLTDSNLLG